MYRNGNVLWCKHKLLLIIMYLIKCLRGHAMKPKDTLLLLIK